MGRSDFITAEVAVEGASSMEAGHDTGSGRRSLAVLRAQSSRPRPKGTATWLGIDQQQAEGTTDRRPHLRLPGSFDVFYQEEYGGLVQLAFVLSGSRSGAEDIAQDALVAAWNKWRELSSRWPGPAGWWPIWPHRASAGGWPRAAPWSA
jgi:hypothetical protein